MLIFFKCTVNLSTGGVITTVPPITGNQACSINRCKNGGSCLTLAGGGFRCVCAPGFTDVLCEASRNYCKRLVARSALFCTSLAVHFQWVVQWSLLRPVVRRIRVKTRVSACPPQLAIYVNVEAATRESTVNQHQVMTLDRKRTKCSFASDRIITDLFNSF